MYVSGYSDLTADEIRRADELIVQLQAFLNTIAPDYGLSPVRTNGIFTGETEVLLTLILRAEGQPAAIVPGIALAIHNATGIGLAYAERWEWAILLAMSRAGRSVAPPSDLLRSRVTDIAPQDDAVVEEKSGWVVPIIALSAGVLVVIGVAIAATRGK